MFMKLFGQTVVTPGIAEKMSDNAEFNKEVQQSLERFCKCDWGEMSERDKETNNERLKSGGRLFAAYETVAGKIWIINEADRFITTVLFPSEY